METIQYTITHKKADGTAKGTNYTLELESRHPDFQCSILAVTREQFNAVEVAGKVTIVISPIPALEVVEGEEVAADHA